MRYGLPALLLLSCGFFAGSAPAETPAGGAEVVADRMLAAIGGRERWASLRNTVNDSLQFRLEEPFVVRAVIRMDFTQPRFRVDTTAPGLTLARVVDGEARGLRRCDAHCLVRSRRARRALCLRRAR
jgi:hypothetical protein